MGIETLLATSLPYLLGAAAVSGVASAGLGFVAQQQAAQQQSKLARANAQAAGEANKAQQAQIADQFWQKRGQQVLEANQMDIQQEQAIARARVSGGEAGVSGLVLDSTIQGINFQRGQNQAIEQQNLAQTAADTENARINANAQALDRARSQSLGVTPSILSPILQGGNSVVNSLISYKLYTKQGVT